MKTYVEGGIPNTEKMLFSQIRSAVAALPDIDLGYDEQCKQIMLSCHMISRAVSRLFGLKCQDGFFHPFFQHSWLVTPSGNVIDVYPVGMMGGPILMDRIVAKDLYKVTSAKRLSHGRFSKNSFRRSVRRLVVALDMINLSQLSKVSNGTD